jgi:hypothetical protein
MKTVAKRGMKILKSANNLLFLNNLIPAIFIFSEQRRPLNI